MNANWNDFNDADSQASFDLIPKGTIVPVRMTIKPGGFDDPNRGWTGGFATNNQETGSVYLSCEFVVTEGPFARRKVWSLIGLSSPKGPEWGNMGRSFVRGILNSSRGIKDKDDSQQAGQARRINGFADLDGIEFLAKIDVEKDQNDENKNVIKFAITPDHKEYQGFKGGGGGGTSAPATPQANQGWQPNQTTQTQTNQNQAPQQNATPAQTQSARPSWAQ